LLAQYVANHLRKFHEIYNIRAVVDKDELIRVWGQKVKGQGLYEALRSEKSRTLGGIFSLIARVHEHILMKLITITQYQVCLAVMTFQGHWFKGQGHFPKMHCWWRNTDQ